MAIVTVPAEADCDYLLVTNADPDLAVGYQENGDAMPHAFARANQGKLVTQLIEGREGPIAFRGIEGNSDVFERTFLVSMDTAGNPVTTFDRIPFDPLIAICEAQVPCVTLLDGHGKRWYTAPEFLTGTYTFQMHEHQATVRFTELDGGPFPVITDDPWT